MVERTCSIDGCEAPHYGRGMCKPHYRKDYYQRNKARENANFKAYREANLDREKARFAAYADRRWGAERAALAQAKADRIAAAEKPCTKCGERKPKDQFHKDPRRVDGRYSWCKSCFHEQVASTRDPERDAERRRAAYADPERRERRQESHRKWAKANPEKNREHARARAARKRDAAIGEVDYGLIIERDGMYCYLCRTDISDLGVLHFDHVVPLVRGGAHSMDNIKPTHGTCNQRKHSKLLSELDWYKP